VSRLEGGAAMAAKGRPISTCRPWPYWSAWLGFRRHLPLDHIAGTTLCYASQERLHWQQGDRLGSRVGCATKPWRAFDLQQIIIRSANQLDSFNPYSASISPAASLKSTWFNWMSVSCCGDTPPLPIPLQPIHPLQHPPPYLL